MSAVEVEEKEKEEEARMLGGCSRGRRQPPTIRLLFWALRSGVSLDDSEAAVQLHCDYKPSRRPGDPIARCPRSNVPERGLSLNTEYVSEVYSFNGSSAMNTWPSQSTRDWSIHPELQI